MLLSESASSPRQAKRLADERKVSHVQDRIAHSSKYSTVFRATTLAGFHPLSPEGR
jgi:hypothetical protein